MIKELLGWLEKAGIAPELIILVLILFVSVGVLYIVAKVYFLAIRAYADFREKQAMCDVIHNTQDIKIEIIGKAAEEAKEDSKEALTIVRKVEKCTEKIIKKVDDTASFLEDKYKNGKEKKSSKVEAT